MLRADHAVYVEGGGYVSTTGDVYTQPPLPDRLDLRARVRAAQLGMSASWQGKTSATEANVQLVQGLRDAGARQEADLIDLSFHRARVFARRNDRWGDGAFNTFVAATAQRSPSRLPLAEKITFGGNFFGAAYSPGEANGDSGWAAAVEVSKPFKVDNRFFQSIEPYVGTDYARVKTTNQAFQRDALTSATLGVRLALPRKYQLSISAAKPVGAAPIFETGRPVRWNLQGSVSF